jgi:alkylresorcinol/alkylpyrone synthase
MELQPVRITSVCSAHPAGRLFTEEALELAEGFGIDPRKVAALARNSRIEARAISFPVEQLASLGSIAARNDLYRRLAPGLACEAASRAMGERDPDDFVFVATSSCTGYSVPGWALDLVEKLDLPLNAVRIPITEAGCSGGALAMASASHYLRSQPHKSALAVSTELCSLTFHGPFEEDNLRACLLFGDGAGAAVLESGTGAGLEVIDTYSYLVPHSRHVLGFDLTDLGFTTILSRQLPDIIAPALSPAIEGLLSRHGLSADDIDSWLIHPGGPRILETVESKLGTRREQMRWSWESMTEFGNTSSAAVYDVLARYLQKPPPAGEKAVLAAFGPGVSIELILLESQY